MSKAQADKFVIEIIKIINRGNFETDQRFRLLINELLDLTSKPVPRPLDSVPSHFAAKS